MVALSDIRQHRAEIQRIAREFGATDLRVFGSVARGHAAAHDLDLLVRMDEDRSLLDRIALQQALRDLLKIDVDVVSERSLDPLVRPHVMRELVEL